MDILIENMRGSLWAAAVTEKGELDGIELDPPIEGVRWGAIYWARVEKIDASMGAAFLDLGHHEEGIIYLRDYRKIKKDGTGEKAKDKTIGQVLKAGDMILVQAKTATLPPEMQQDLTLDEHKVARVSMDISIPGRFLIYTPMDTEKRISSRISEAKTRKRMMDMLKKVETIKSCILRSASADVQTDVLVRESKILKRIWEQLQDFKRGEVPSLIMEGPDAVQRLLGDMADRAIDKIITTDEQQYLETEEWCDIYAPDWVPKVQQVEIEGNEGDIGLFEQYGMVDEVQGLVRPYEVLESGGNIIIQDTNALTAIDVNMGAAKSKSQTNIEAAKEAARQLRLRNIGGIIMIDFINMRGKKLKDELIQIMKNECAKDPCTVDVHGFTRLGLMELSRARRTPQLLERLQITTAVHEAGG